MERRIIQPARKSLGKHVRDFFMPQHLVLQAMLIPALVALILFSYLPMSGIVISVKEYTLGIGFFDGRWVGLKYFRQVLTDETFWRAARNTVVILCLIACLFSFFISALKVRLFQLSLRR